MDQLGLKESSSEFNNGARIIVGDLKTLNLIQGLKKLREDTTEEAGYDTYKWIIPNLGLFHLRMNMLQLIHGAHWGGTATEPAQWDDASTLQWQADMFGNSRSTRSGKEVQALDQLVRHSHHARVIAVMVNVLKEFVPGFEVNTREVDREKPYSIHSTRPPIPSSEMVNQVCRSWTYSSGNARVLRLIPGTQR